MRISYYFSLITWPGVLGTTVISFCIVHLLQHCFYREDLTKSNDVSAAKQQTIMRLVYLMYCIVVVSSIP